MRGNALPITLVVLIAVFGLISFVRRDQSPDAIVADWETVDYIDNGIRLSQSDPEEFETFMTENYFMAAFTDDGKFVKSKSLEDQDIPRGFWIKKGRTYVLQYEDYDNEYIAHFENDDTDTLFFQEKKDTGLYVMHKRNKGDN